MNRPGNPVSSWCRRKPGLIRISLIFLMFLLYDSICCYVFLCFFILGTRSTLQSVSLSVYVCLSACPCKVARLTAEIDDAYKDLRQHAFELHAIWVHQGTGRRTDSGGEVSSDLDETLGKFFLQASRSFLYSPGALYPSGKRENEGKQFL